MLNKLHKDEKLSVTLKTIKETQLAIILNGRGILTKDVKDLEKEWGNI